MYFAKQLPAKNTAGNCQTEVTKPFKLADVFDEQMTKPFQWADVFVKRMTEAIQRDADFSERLTNGLETESHLKTESCRYTLVLVGNPENTAVVDSASNFLDKI